MFSSNYENGKHEEKVKEYIGHGKKNKFNVDLLYLNEKYYGELLLGVICLA